MIKPLEEYSPEDRAFVEYVQKIRSQPPKPRHNPGPFNREEVKAILAEIPQEDRDELFEAIRGRNR
ncbi:MAG: hypothetical protein WDO56_11425 [Gammaproteobacteria bacterium]